ncbi:MAG: hypothetical protein ABGY42_09100 [bacterium]
MCQQETFDPKPYAPVEYRGPMNSIATKVEGVRINETWKQTAKITTPASRATNVSSSAMRTPSCTIRVSSFT